MNLYSIRRENVSKDLGKNSIIVVYSNDNIKSQDVFNVNKNFYYLTGIDEPDCALVITNFNNKITSKLLITPNDPKEAKWTGNRISSNEASELSGITNIDSYLRINDILDSLFDRVRIYSDAIVYLDLWKEQGVLTNAQSLATRIKKEYPAVGIDDLYPIITQYRLVKDESEITCITQAIAITNIGIQSMMKTIKPRMNEMSLEGLFNFILFQNKCNKTAFKTICASGPRATILHYEDNDQDTKEGDLLLCDLGATYKNYCADISRTFPVSGKFSARQKELYQVVLTAQRIVQDNAVVGNDIKKLTELVVEYYKRELPKHGLKKDVSEYFYHSVSHQLGLDVHDVDGGLGNILKAGMVITNEPGLYVAEEGIGIRIEDDLLITSTGAQCLSSNIAKSPEDIELLMRKR